MNLAPLRRRARKAGKRVREMRMLVRAFQFPYKPVAAHLIPVRRCNLACRYCNEFDDHSAPVPAADVFRRVDLLARLGTGIITLSGGEPLLHPDLDAIRNPEDALTITRRARELGFSTTVGLLHDGTGRRRAAVRLLGGRS